MRLVVRDRRLNLPALVVVVGAVPIVVLLALVVEIGFQGDDWEQILQTLM